jgi:iron complex transport system substrate-binding protein
MNTPHRPTRLQPADASRRHWLAGLAGVAAATSTWPLGTLAATPAAGQAPRLITVGGAITEVVYLLGAERQLVGSDTTSLYPPAAQQTAKVGYMRQLSAEGLLSLRPDVLVTTTEAGPTVVLDQLRSAGVRVEQVVADHQWPEVGRKIAAVGRAAGRERDAQALQQRLEDDWKKVQARVAAHQGRRPRVLFILAHSGSPMVSGRKTAADAVIRYMGADNAMGAFEGYRPMTAEAMAQAAPDVVLTTTQGIEALGGEHRLWERTELALTPAWKHRAQGRSLVHMDALVLIGFGPRLPAAVGELHERVVRG